MYNKEAIIASEKTRLLNTLREAVGLSLTWPGADLLTEEERWTKVIVPAAEQLASEQRGAAWQAYHK